MRPSPARDFVVGLFVLAGLGAVAYLSLQVGGLSYKGPGGLTHREVAATAGVSLARVSYHYPSAEDLLVAAAGHYLATFDARLRALAGGSRTGERTIVDACTEFMFELVTTRAQPFLRALEVRVALHQRGHSVDDSAILDLIRSFGTDERRATAIYAAMFGFATLTITGPDPVEPEQVRHYVELVLGSIV